MIVHVPHHIDMLLAEFARRKEKNSRYSLRAYAKSLGMSSATLSRILSLGQDISLEAAKKIIKKLKYNDAQTLVFIRSIADEKCQRAYSVLPLKAEGNIFPHEKNAHFISDHNHRCIFVNDVASRLKTECLNGDIEKVFTCMGFEKDVVKFACSCIDNTLKTGIARKHNLPLRTQVGKLSIQTLFMPLFGQEGEVKAVSSILLNLNLDILKPKSVSNS